MGGGHHWRRTANARPNKTADGAGKAAAPSPDEGQKTSKQYRPAPAAASRASRLANLLHRAVLPSQRRRSLGASRYRGGVTRASLLSNRLHGPVSSQHCQTNGKLESPQWQKDGCPPTEHQDSLTTLAEYNDLIQRGREDDFDFKWKGN